MVSQAKITIMKSIPGIHVRNIDRDELKKYRKELIRIYQRAYQGMESYAYSKTTMIKNYLNWLHRGDPGGFFVAFKERQPVAFVSGHRRWFFDGQLWGEVHELVVDPAYQGKGIAAALIETVLDYFWRNGEKRAGLWVGRENEHARNFYERLGFKPAGVHGKWERWVIDDLDRFIHQLRQQSS